MSDDISTELSNYINQFKGNNNKTPNIGITGFVPQEIFYKEGCRPVDITNWVRGHKSSKSIKLCAWASSWRDILLGNPSLIDGLVVVGDCNTSLTEAQRVIYEHKIENHFFFYPLDGDTDKLYIELKQLEKFVKRISQKHKSIPNPSAPLEIKKIKDIGRKLDRLRCSGEIDEIEVIKLLGSFSDMEGDTRRFYNKCETLYSKKIQNKTLNGNDKIKTVGMIGVPPIIPDFYTVCSDIGLKVIFNEMGLEYLKRGGLDLHEMAKSYANYVFVRPLEYRIESLKNELHSRECMGLIHYVQYACHHMLEDDIIRQSFDIPILTIQSDLPRRCDGQIKLRLEAFYESL